MKILISEASRVLERSRDTILRYEERGLLTVERTTRGVRIYDLAEVERLKAALDSPRQTK
jgi:DNA-binding transcriptional MerR regulator